MIYYICGNVYAEEEAKGITLCFFLFLILTGGKRATTTSLLFLHVIPFFTIKLMPLTFPAWRCSAARSFKDPGAIMATNPRSANGNLRRKYRARFKAMAAPCGICRGALGPIDYEAPSNSTHPLSFVIDEIKPISRWREFGYESPEAAARDWTNLQAAHYCCNAAKSNHILPTEGSRRVLVNLPDGDW